MPELKKPNDHVELKTVITLLTMVASIVAAFYSIKVDMSSHEQRLRAAEHAQEYQWRTIDALRNDLGELRQDAAMLKAKVERIH